MVKRHQLVIMALLASAMGALPGCSSLGLQSEQERQFAAGLQSLQLGNQQQASNLFERIVSAPPVAGVTDEVLFRLALLQLAEDAGSKGMARSQVLLDRLKKEFPDSPWAPHATALVSWFAGSRGSREQINQLTREYRELVRENRELRQNIERLKNLDIEIEKKRKR